MPSPPINKPEKPYEIAAIDLGSNSFHMVVARIVNGALQILSRVKQRVHLASGLDEQAHLSEEAIVRGLSCLSMFAERLQGFPAENVRLIGTYTLREATNADEFLERAAKILPYPIEIISGQEEARLIYMGVAHTQPEQGQKLVIDIGGGSTELVIGNEFDTLLAESRSMGCVSYEKTFFPNGELSPQRFQQAKISAIRKLENLSWQFRQQGWRYALGASGTIKTIQNVLIGLGEKDGLITPERLQYLIDLVIKNKHADNLSFAGLSDERRYVFVPGLAILSAVFDSLQIKVMRFSDGALREGTLYEMEERFRHQDIRSRTATSLAEHYNIDRDQAQRVLNCVQLLYKQWLTQNRKLEHPKLEALLNWAALLHEVGLSINHSGLQRHSAYILQHTNLPGFNQEQQLVLATLVRLHRKSAKLNDLPKLSMFDKKQYLPMAQLLRLAVLLNNQRQATTQPDSLRLLTTEEEWQLFFPTGFLEKNSLLQADLEEEQNYWQEVSGWKLGIKEEIP